MKTNNFKLFSVLKSIILIASISIVTISCDNKDSDGTDGMNSSKSSIGETFKSINSAPAPGQTPIAGIAVNAGFTELVKSLAYVDKELNAGLVNLFTNGTNQYTVFAPTDAAFHNLYAALNVDDITDLPAPLVLNVLKYHVVEGRRAANSVVPKSGSRNITTLLGATFAVNADGTIAAVGNNASIVIPNISASNGIIHVVDTVLLPIK